MDIAIIYSSVTGNTKNTVSIHITDEDIEEILSDVFVAVWKNMLKYYL